MPYVVEPMRFEDIPVVMEIEKESFSLPWPASAYRRELNTPNVNRYLVARYVRGPLPKTTDHHSEGRKSFFSSLLPFFFTSSSAPSPYPIVGYGGLWLMVDEAHVTTLAVRPSHRGRGVGELLLVGLIDTAVEMAATWLTLEVRVSNHVAQSLYRKYGFKETGVRRHYYSDNGEDALIMWSDPITSAAFTNRFQRLKSELARKLADSGPETVTDLPESKSIEHSGD
jgi:[ribosomal protein S18]-alanine N-acetyltransferase